MKRLKLFTPIFWGVLQLNWSSSYPSAHPGLALEEISFAFTSAFISSSPSSPPRQQSEAADDRGGKKSYCLALFLHHRSAPLRRETLLPSWLMNVVFVCHAYQSPHVLVSFQHLPLLLMMLFAPTLWLYLSNGARMQGKRGALRVKPEIGSCDNNFKEQRNQAEMFVEEFCGFHLFSPEITTSLAMICTRENTLTAIFHHLPCLWWLRLPS